MFIDFSNRLAMYEIYIKFLIEIVCFTTLFWLMQNVF